jgi:hypothetical protein
VTGRSNDLDPIVLGYPLSGRLRVRNSPANRVPSHGTHLMGTTYAIDFVPVDRRGRSAAWTPRALLGTERPETFYGFGAPVLAPHSGVVVVAHDGEADHEARRSQLSLLRYMARQSKRLRQGAGAIAGNHIVIDLTGEGPYVLVAHLRSGSLCVAVGDSVAPGQPIGQCGNSGNSTQPHVHVQATDSLDWPRARGLPIAFTGAHGPELPRESQVIMSPTREERMPRETQAKRGEQSTSEQ